MRVVWVQDALIGGGIVGVVACFVLVGLALLRDGVSGDALAAPPLTHEIWHPSEPPRSDVECWRSGHAVVCLPVQK